eukprot:9708308-Ditylum_brightwellii.AAC.1
MEVDYIEAGNLPRSCKRVLPYFMTAQGLKVQSPEVRHSSGNRMAWCWAVVPVWCWAHSRRYGMLLDTEDGIAEREYCHIL